MGVEGFRRTVHRTHLGVALGFHRSPELGRYRPHSWLSYGCTRVLKLLQATTGSCFGGKTAADWRVWAGWRFAKWIILRFFVPNYTKLFHRCTFVSVNSHSYYPANRGTSSSLQQEIQDVIKHYTWITVILHSVCHSDEFPWSSIGFYLTAVNTLNVFFYTALQTSSSSVMNNGGKFHLTLQQFPSALIVLGKQQSLHAITEIVPHSSAAIISFIMVTMLDLFLSRLC